MNIGAHRNPPVAIKGTTKMKSFRSRVVYTVSAILALFGAWGLALASPAGGAAQTIKFTSTAPISPNVGSTYTPTATARDATGSPTSLPVTFSIDNASTVNACTINPATSEVTFTDPGICLIDANQGGGTHVGITYAAAMQVQQSIPVDMTGQSIAFTSTAPATANVSTTYTPTAISKDDVTGKSMSLPVTFTIDNASTPGACSINTTTAQVTCNAAGNCIIDANQSGGAAGGVTYAAAPQLQQSVSVGTNTLASQTIAFNTSIPAIVQLTDT
jgi:hypothetical protein